MHTKWGQMLQTTFLIAVVFMIQEIPGEKHISTKCLNPAYYYCGDTEYTIEYFCCNKSVRPDSDCTLTVPVLCKKPVWLEIAHPF